MSFIKSHIRWLDKTVWFPPFSCPAIASLRPCHCCLLHNPRFTCMRRTRQYSRSAPHMALFCSLPLLPVHMQCFIYLSRGADLQEEAVEQVDAGLCSPHQPRQHGRARATEQPHPPPTHLMAPSPDRQQRVWTTAAVGINLLHYRSRQPP